MGLLDDVIKEVDSADSGRKPEEKNGETDETRKVKKSENKQIFTYGEKFNEIFGKK